MYCNMIIFGILLHFIMVREQGCCDWHHNCLKCIENYMEDFLRYLPIILDSYRGD